MKIPASKIVTLVLGALVIVLAGVSAYEYQYPRQTTPLEAIKEDKSQGKVLTASTPKLHLDEETPKGTITPSELNAKLDDYKGKEVKVRGLISGNETSGYAVLDQDGDKPYGFKLVAANPGVDFAKYAMKDLKVGQPGQDVYPVTVTGTLEVNAPASGADASGSVIIKASAVQR